MYAFNFSISFCSMYDHFSTWFRQEDSAVPIVYRPRENLSFPFTTLLSAEQVLDKIFNSLYSWMRSLNEFHIDWQTINDSLLSYRPIDGDRGGNESSAKIRILPTLRFDSDGSTSIYSFHYPLHRFYGSLIRELSLYPHHISTLFNHLKSIHRDHAIDINVNHTNQFPSSPLNSSIAVHPLRVLSFASQVKHGHWRRNGMIMEIQIFNYLEPPFNKNLRNIDVFLLQIMLASAINEEIEKSGKTMASILPRCCCP